MARSYGRFRYLSKGPAGRPCWALVAEPHVRIKLKRVLPRVDQDETGMILLTATPEVARDLQWFMDRYPLDPVGASSLAELERQAAAYIAGEEQVLRILEGQQLDHPAMTPALKPRPYQLVVPAMLRATGRLLVGDDVGLGKTLSGSLILCDPDALPAVVVTLTHLARQWKYELGLYYPWLRTHIVTQGTPYEPVTRRDCQGQEPDVLIFNYHKLGGWGDYLQGRARTVIFDEAQELRTGFVGPSRPTPRKYIAATMIARSARYRVLLTATPVYNYGDEIHSVIAVMDPDALGTREEFLREHGGKVISDPRALGSYLRDSGLMIRRTRKEVGRELPPVSRIEQPVETDTAKLAELTKGIAEMARVVLDSHANPQDRYTVAGQLDMRLRHATNLAKAPFVAEFVRLLLEEEKKVLLVGWHRDVYEVWLETLAEYKPVLYSGSESPKQKEDNRLAFIQGDSRVLIMSLRSGAGLNGLQDVCSTVVFGELDWSPAQHHQVIGRLARDGQTNPVAAFFCVCDDGADPPMAEILDLKRMQADPIVDPDAELVAPSPAAALERVKALASEVLRRERDANRAAAARRRTQAREPATTGALF